MNIYTERINSLREEMKKAGVTYYLCVTADPHLSEYINETYMERQFLSGFTGSNGSLLVGEETALLWTDGRYFVQAEEELAGSGIILMKSLQKDVPTIEEYLGNNLREGDVLGFCGTLISASYGERLEKVCVEKGATLKYDKDLVDNVWLDRPPLNPGKIWILKDDIAGENAASKMDRVRKYLEKKNADGLFLAKLDDIMWLLNIRGCDIECNPVAYSYFMLRRDKAILAISPSAVESGVKDYFDRLGVELIDYCDFADMLNEGGVVLMDKETVTYKVAVAAMSGMEVCFCPNITERYKAVKNDTEMFLMKKYYLKDSLELTRFLHYVKENALTDELTETSAAEKLDLMRREIPGFIDLSFPTISACGPNAAKMHYEAEKGKDASFENSEFYLVDSGAQYMGATTDVTRTIAIGEVSEEMKKHFTLVAMGMLRLQNTVFLKGCTGRNLDIVAREPLWEEGIDYKCGTGHGIGYILNVHEGPQSIRYGKSKDDVAFEEGMIVSDEPGVYIAGKYGIRTENILLTREGEENGDGRFMYFEPLTYVPIDLDAINTELMDKSDIRKLNEYHEAVYTKLSPMMNEEEQRWLRYETRMID